MTQHAGQSLEVRSLDRDRAVKWLPLDDGYYLLASVMTSTRAAPVYVMQQVLLQVESHQAMSEGDQPCGILCGSACVDPQTGTEYILIQDTERVPQTDADTNADAALAADLSKVIARVERVGRHVMGWYRCDVPLGQLISLRNVGLHRSLFSKPYQVALFRDGVMGQGRGALVRVEPNEGRAFSIPFVEISAHRRRHGAPLLTSVHWLNYRSESDVALLADDAFLEGYRFPVEEPMQQEQRRPGLFSGLFGRHPVSVTPRRSTPTAVERSIPLEPHTEPSAQRSRDTETVPALRPEADRPHASLLRPTAPAPIAPAPIAPAPTAPAPTAPAPIAPAPIAAKSALLDATVQEQATASRTITPKVPAPKATSRKAAARSTIAPGTNFGGAAAPSPSQQANHAATDPPPATQTPAVPESSFPPADDASHRDVPVANDHDISPRPGPANDSDWPERSVPVFDEGTEPQRAEALDELLAELRRRVRIEPSPAHQPPTYQSRRPRGWLAKRTLGLAAVLIAGFLALQGVAALRTGKRGAADGELDPNRFRGPGSTQSAAAASASPTPSGALTADQLAQARSALASIGISGDSLQSHLDALDSTLAGARRASTRAASCARATSLYQKAQADSAQMRTAQQQLTQLMGPAPMDRVDMLFGLLGRARPSMRATCK